MASPSRLCPLSRRYFFRLGFPCLVSLPPRSGFLRRRVVGVSLRHPDSGLTGFVLKNTRLLRDEPVRSQVLRALGCLPPSGSVSYSLWSLSTPSLCSPSPLHSVEPGLPASTPPCHGVQACGYTFSAGPSVCPLRCFTSRLETSPPPPENARISESQLGRSTCQFSSNFCQVG